MSTSKRQIKSHPIGKKGREEKTQILIEEKSQSPLIKPLAPKKSIKAFAKDMKELKKSIYGDLIINAVQKKISKIQTF